MKKIITLTIIGTFALTHPAFAQSQDDESVKTDVQALDKDNAALEGDQRTLSKDRVAKAMDKVNDENGKQAVDSVKIGAVKTAIEEKTLEKDADQKILDHQKAEMKKDDAATVPSANE